MFQYVMKFFKKKFNLLNSIVFSFILIPEGNVTLMTKLGFSAVK